VKIINGISPRKDNTLLKNSLFANVFVINSFVVDSFDINGLLAVCIPTVLYAFSSNLSDDAAKVNQLGYIEISAREQVVL